MVPGKGKGGRSCHGLFPATATRPDSTLIQQPVLRNRANMQTQQMLERKFTNSIRPRNAD